MILTVTPNPSIDLLYEAERLAWDDANRVEMPRRRAGGQGINLTRAARLLGGNSLAVAFLGGRAGDELRALLDADATPYVSVPVAGETRTFVAVRETETGRSLLVNPRGPVLSAEERARLLAEVEVQCMRLRPDWLVCSGSVPRGVGNDLYGHAAGIAHAAGARFSADCDGEPLRLAIEKSCDLLAPNRHEAGRLLGTHVTSIEEAVAAARALLRAAPRVLIKLGENGAVLAQADACWHARGKDIRSGSAVGAGDAFLAAFLVADKNGAPPEEALRSAVAAGAAVLLGTGEMLLSTTDYTAQLRAVELVRVA